jgi:hypothetical protein
MTVSINVFGDEIEIRPATNGLLGSFVGQETMSSFRQIGANHVASSARQTASISALSSDLFSRREPPAFHGSSLTIG